MSQSGGPPLLPGTLLMLPQAVEGGTGPLPLAVVVDGQTMVEVIPLANPFERPVFTAHPTENPQLTALVSQLQAISLCVAELAPTHAAVPQLQAQFQQFAEGVGAAIRNLEHSAREHADQSPQHQQ